MKNLKRTLCLLLAMVMVLSMVPATVFAAEATPALPTAKVSEITKDDLTFAMNFRVNPVDDEQLAHYGSWYADFELTINKKVLSTTMAQLTAGWPVSTTSGLTTGSPFPSARRLP